MQARVLPSFLPVAVVAVVAIATAAGAHDDVPGTGMDTAALVEALRLPEVIEIMRDEGVSYGSDLEGELFPGQGGAGWEARVAQIYDTERLQGRFAGQLSAMLEQSAHVPEMVAFFSSPQGQEIVDSEIQARRELLDESVETASRERLEEMQAADDPRLSLLEALVDASDLVEANVEGALNSNLAFYYGLIDGGAFDVPPTEQEVLSDVWVQEEVIREETEEWIYAYLAMAYDPLPDEVLEEYLAFARSAAGQSLNRALFAGFDVVFTDISRQLGLAAARYIGGQEI